MKTAEGLMQFNDLLKMQSEAEGQPFLDKLEGPDLVEFKCDLRIRRWKLLELVGIWIASVSGILIGIILLRASNGGLLWYSTVLIGTGLVFAVYAYRRVVHYLEWFIHHNPVVACTFITTSVFKHFYLDK